MHIRDDALLALSEESALEFESGIRYQVTHVVDSLLREKSWRERISYLLDLAQPSQQFQGRFVWMKKIVAKLATPIVRRQAEFNQLLVGEIMNLADALEEERKKQKPTTASTNKPT